MLTVNRLRRVCASAAILPSHFLGAWILNVFTHQQIILFPSIGQEVDGGAAWKITVSGAVIEPGKIPFPKRMLLPLLRRAMRAPRDAFDTEIFKTRIHAFAATASRGRQIAIRIGGAMHLLPRKTTRAGMFEGSVYVPADETGVEPHGCLNFKVIAAKSPGRRAAAVECAGRAYLLPPKGTSVISDIDDTIKHSSVTNRRALLQNTFLREFQPVFGMAQLYRQWARQGAALHYVSSSPWQLYNPLASLCGDDEMAEEKFPGGTFHLRYFRLADHMLRRFMFVRLRGKAKVINKIVRAFPQRRFILVGDSGEHDPEIYVDVARRFPQQVKHVFIRDLPERPINKARRKRLQKKLADGVLSTFYHAHELPSELPDDLNSGGLIL